MMPWRRPLATTGAMSRFGEPDRIDLAARVDDLKVGDTVELNGEYDWDPRGGVIHWTHHGPLARNASGWLRHHGRSYQ
jgi:hypothetical protein